MGFSQQKYWSGLPCPPPGVLPKPGIKSSSPVSLAWQENSLLLSHWESPHVNLVIHKIYLHIMHMNIIFYIFSIYINNKKTKCKQWLNFAVASCPLFITLQFSDFLHCECVFKWTPFWTMENSTATLSLSLVLEPHIWQLVALALWMAFPTPSWIECAQQNPASSLSALG